MQTSKTNMDKMGRSFLISIAMLQVLSGGLPVEAEEPIHAQPVNWSGLGLSPNQSQQIKRLETEWRSKYVSTYPKIQQDRARLRQLMNDPQSSEEELMQTQDRLRHNEEMLRNEAMRTFINKKRQLTPEQRQALRQMMVPANQQQ